MTNNLRASLDQLHSGPETKLAALIGYPANYSLSPQLHEAAYASISFDARYVSLPVKSDQLEPAVRGIRALGMLGVSVTIPYKKAVLDLVDEVSAHAASIDAANTIVNNDGRLVAHTTDGPGFIQGLRAANFDPNVKSVALIGAGGSARSVAHALAVAGAADIAIVARNIERAAEAALACGEPCRVGSAEDIAQADLVVNATPVGMTSSPGVPFDLQLLNSGQFIADLIYAPIETELLRHGRLIGAQTINGIPMLVHQAALQVELFTGTLPSIDPMLGVLSSEARRSYPFQSDTGD